MRPNLFRASRRVAISVSATVVLTLFSDSSWCKPVFGEESWQSDAAFHGVESGEFAVEAACMCGNSSACQGVCRDAGHPKKPIVKKPGDRNRGDCPPLRYRMSDADRAGNPHCVHRWAKCSVNEKYSAWFVGGGSAFNGKIASVLGRVKLHREDDCHCEACRAEPGKCGPGREREESEGTWGLDYSGLFKRKKPTIWLKYTRERKQGGEGAYATDGEPKIISKTHELLGLGH